MPATETSTTVDVSPITQDVPALGGSHLAQLYGTLIEALPHHVFFKDRDSVFLSVNSAFAADFGKRPQDFLGKSDFHLFPAELAEKYAADDRRIMDAGQAETFEEVNVVHGRRRYVEVTKSPVRDESGNVIGLLGIFTDVTARREAEEELKRSRSFLNSVVDNLPIPVFIKRASDLRFVLWNKVGASMTGHAAADYLGKTDHDFFAKEEADFFVARDREVLAKRELLEIEEWMQTPHRGTRVFRTRKVPILADNGEPEFLLGIFEDITERKAAEEKLKQFAAQLEHNNRELQDFAYVASHDLQEPLRKVRAFGDRLKTNCGASLSDDGKDYLERMLNAARRMQTLIEDLLAFSRVTTRGQPFVKVDLSQVAREVISDLEVRIEQQQGRVEVATLPVIDADPTQMRQLLQNLIGNALKFSRKDVLPVVKVSARPLEVAASKSAGPQQETIQLLVEDNGIGFDEKYLDRIFTVFQRLHGRGEYEGTGVGLAICRKIAVRHGGDITAKSQPGTGATFIVTLPVTRTHPL
jgi:two-component system, LuxR family, sensor kinase FixL